MMRNQVVFVLIGRGGFIKNVSAMTEKILQFVYTFQLVPKKSIRSLGFSYVYSGKVVNKCIEKDFLKEQRSQGENLLRITDKGIKYLESLQGFPFPEQLFKEKYKCLILNMK